MSPSSTLGFKPHITGQRLIDICNFISAICRGEKHFTARIRNPSNELWSCDGMWRFGAARRDRTETTTDALYNGRHCATSLIYCCTDMYNLFFSSPGHPLYSIVPCVSYRLIFAYNISNYSWATSFGILNAHPHVGHPASI